MPITEVEEFSDWWAPYGSDLMMMKGGSSWASTLHHGPAGWRSWAIDLYTELACYSLWSGTIQ